MDNELKEWLGLTPQDGLVYASGFTCLALYFIDNLALDIVAAGFAVCASLLACYWGMRPDPKLSEFTNWVKKVSYPLCLAIVVLCVVLNFVLWNA